MPQSPSLKILIRARLGNTYQMEKLFTVILAVMGATVQLLANNRSYDK